MIVTRFFEPAIAQTSYLIGCAATGHALVVDPNRDVDQYLRAAEREGVRITHVTETHIHADFASGLRELVARTGATAYLSDEGDAAWKYAFGADATLIRDGDRITVGNIRIDVLATPGHTPEHLTFLVTDGAAADRPIAAITGDFIFVGDVGRPDLLERAANMRGTMEAGARTLWRSLQAFNRDHDEWLQIWPGHGAGSACGKGISAIPHSTLGYERRFNWAFAVPDEEAFVAAVLDGQPEPPAYFARMKALNKAGPALLSTRTAPARLDDAAVAGLLARGAQVIDTRPAGEFAAAHLPGTLSLPLNAGFVNWAGWLLPYDQDLHLILADSSPERIAEARRLLSLIGLDRVAGVVDAGVVERAAAKGAAIDTVAQMSVDELAGHVAARDVHLIDVRSANEWRAGHIGGATHIPLGYLSGRLAEVPDDRPIVLQCLSGSRSAIAASLLRRLGRVDVVNLIGGIDAWRAAHLPVQAA
ncbi:MAG: rhodanese-like domain-containing protein [Vicinamibacterales bacterium]